MKRLLIMLIAVALVGIVLVPASTVVAAASATRSLPSSVAAGANFDVDISTAEYGAFGQVVETLPAGFSYVSSTLSVAAVSVDGQVVKFTLLGETAFSYTVKASSTAGTYPFTGTLKDVDRVEYAIGGHAEIIVPATRSLPSSVAASGNFDVDISTFDYGAFGQVVETLPAGFSYVSSNLSSEAAVDVEGQVVTFTLLEETAFSYTVTASSTAGSYTFTGTLKDADKAEYAIGEDQITVTALGDGGGGGAPTPPTYYTETNVFGTEARFRIDKDGEILATITATSADGNLTVTIPKGTTALDKDGDRLGSLEAAVDETPPSAPEDCCIIGLVYDFGPDGATFDPPITLEYTYAPAEIPEGVAEEDLVLAYYDEDASEWVECECTCDPETHCITASVSHFSKYAIIGAVTPPEEEEVVPPEEEEVVPPEEEEVALPEEEEVAPPEEEEVVPPEEEEVVPEEIPAKPVNWALIGGIIAAVVVVALLVYFLWFRRRAY